MKKLLSLLIVLVLAVSMFAGCGSSEKTYTLASAVESSIGSDNKISNYVVSLVLDENSKIVAARIDCVETTLTVENGAIANVATVTSKVELGENYKMTAGTFAQQTKAFEDAIVGKSAEEVAALDLALVTGCTMPYSPFSFKAVIAKAFASTNKTTFKTSEAITVGVAASMKVADGKASGDFASVVMAGGNIAAVILDCNEYSATVANNAISVSEYKGTKVELGESYKMTAGTFAQQTEAFENYVTGKSASDIASLDFSLITGCTMPYTPYSFQAVLTKAIGLAR